MSDNKDAVANRLPKVTLIAAVGSDRAIGINGDMPWHLPEDLRHFKETTMGAPVVMGRATWESLPSRPLPGRLNIVISRNTEYATPGATVVNSIEDALRVAEEAEEIFIIGGATIYRATLPLASRLILTEIDVQTPSADTFFPEIENMDWKVADSRGPFMSKAGVTYTFVTYERNDNK